LVQNFEKNIEIKIYINKNYILYYNVNAKKEHPPQQRVVHQVAQLRYLNKL
jgi:hypothetical protein